MGDAHSSATTLDNLIKTLFVLQSLKTLEKECVLRHLASPENVVSLGQGDGDTARWTEFRKIAPASSTLDEASANAAVTLSSRKVEATIASIGRHVKYTDLIAKTSVLSIKQGALDRLMDSALVSYDNRLQLALYKNSITQCGKDGANTAARLLSAYGSAVASAFCADTGTMADSALQFGLPVVMPMSSTKLSGISKTAPSTSAIAGPYAISKGVARIRGFGASKFADGYYRGVLSVEAAADMMQNTQWKSWYQGFESGPKETLEVNEIRPLLGVRLFVSQNAPVHSGTARKAGFVTIVGRECFGITELKAGQGQAVEWIIHDFGDDGNPYNLNSTVAYKFRVAGKVLNPSAGVHVLVAIKS